MFENKIIWMYWAQGLDCKSLPRLNQTCIKRWRNLNLRSWDIEILEDKTLKLYSSDIHDILNDAKYPRTIQAKSDLIRLILLEKYGGVWVDSSVFPLISLDEFFSQFILEEHKQFFAYKFLQESWGRTTASWFLASFKANFFLFELWKKDFISSFINNKNWEYFTIHKCLTDLYKTNVQIRNVIDNMLTLSEAAPHSAMRENAQVIPSAMYKRPHEKIIAKLLQT